MSSLPYLHFFCLLTYAYLAGYILYKDPKSPLNKTCAALMTLFSIWNFADVFSADKDISEDTALLFQNISSIGWIGFASAALCFSLAFTKKEQLLRSAIFMSVIFILPLFLIYKQWTGCITIDPVRQSYGWSYTFTDTVWTYLFYTYYISFTLLTIYFIYRYRKKTDKLSEKKPAIIIIAAIGISLVGGTIFDVIAPELGIYSIPPLANIFILFFASGLAYAIVKYKFLTITPAIAAENIISAMTELLIITDNNGNILNVNSALSDKLKYKQSELTGMSYKKLLERDKLHNSIFKRIANGDIIKNCKCVFLTWDAKEIPVIFSCSPLKDNENEIRGFVFIAKDISESMLARKELRESEERYRSIFNNSVEGIYQVTLEGRCRTVNPAFARMFGYRSPEEMRTAITNIGGQLYVNPEDRERMIEQMSKSEGTVRNFEAQMKRRDGSLFWISINASIQISKGNDILLEGTCMDIAERKYSEYLLMLSNSQLQNALEIAHLGHWEYDVAQNLFIFNDQFYNIFRTTAEQVGGYTMSSADYAQRFVHPDDLPVVGNEIQKAIETTDPGFCRQFDHRMLYADGEMGYISVRFFIVKDSQGHTVRTYGVNQDITERKRNENELKERELKLNTITNSAHDAIIMMDHSGAISFWNNAATNILGWTEAEALGKNLHKLLAPESYHSAHFTAFPHFQKTGKGNAVGKTLELNAVRKDGAQITVELSLSSILLNNNWCAVGIMRDITERKQAEKAVIESELKFRSIFENIQDVYYEVDLKGTIKEVSRSIEILSKGLYKRDDLLGKFIHDYYADTGEREIFLQKIREKGSVTDYEIILKNRDGNEIPCSITSKIVFNDAHAPIKIIGTIRDISDRKKAETDLLKSKEKAEESDRLKSAFLANMSHEIRTPMNGILGFANLLTEPGLTGEKQSEYLGIIEQSGKRMLNIINDIVDISKIESGQMSLNIKETDLNEQILYIYVFFKPEVEKRGMYLKYNNSLADRDAIIKTDKEKIVAVLTNLVKNAIKFTNNGGIEFGYVKNNDFLEFFVKDTGMGIRPEQRNVIFDRFRQGSESMSRDYEGAGLGLSISKAYVEMLGGKMWVTANEPSGSVFYFTIPYLPLQAEKITVTDNVSLKRQGGASPENLKVLIAEDDITSEKILSVFIEEFCREKLYAKTGIDAVEICRKNPDIDMILMDVKMPGMNGYDTTREIRKFNKNVIIIAQTAYAFTGENEKAKEAGCNDYISKPISKEALVEIIRKYF